VSTACSTTSKRASSTNSAMPILERLSLVKLSRRVSEDQNRELERKAQEPSRKVVIAVDHSNSSGISVQLPIHTKAAILSVNQQKKNGPCFLSVNISGEVAFLCSGGGELGCQVPANGKRRGTPDNCAGASHAKRFAPWGPPSSVCDLGKAAGQTPLKIKNHPISGCQIGEPNVLSACQNRTKCMLLVSMMKALQCSLRCVLNAGRSCQHKHLHPIIAPRQTSTSVRGVCAGEMQTFVCAS
jgi:hypothetical protein